MPQPSVTLQKFYTEFLTFIKVEEKRWANNEKRWLDNAKTLKSLRKRIDYSIGFLDREIMADRRRIDTLEQRQVLS